MAQPGLKTLASTARTSVTSGREALGLIKTMLCQTVASFIWCFVWRVLSELLPRAEPSLLCWV